jgi:hypothetical protein
MFRRKVICAVKPTSNELSIAATTPQVSSNPSASGVPEALAKEMPDFAR